MSSRLITASHALDMLETMAPRPWARKMLAWHIFETDNFLNFYSGKIVDKIVAFDLLQLAERNELMDCEKIFIDAAKGSDPFSEVEITSRQQEFPISIPVDAAPWLETFDWENGVAKGSLRSAEIANLDRFEELVPLYDMSWIELDLSDLRFELAFIEMLAPLAPVPKIDLIDMEANIPKKREPGPGRRRKHDWDGALVALIGEAERNSIAADPEAHGAQADIAARLADWFAKSDLPIPAHSLLQEKAKDVLASIRAANPE